MLKLIRNDCRKLGKIRNDNINQAMVRNQFYPNMVIFSRKTAFVGCLKASRTETTHPSVSDQLTSLLPFHRFLSPRIQSTQRPCILSISVENLIKRCDSNRTLNYPLVCWCLSTVLPHTWMYMCGLSGFTYVHFKCHSRVLLHSWKYLTTHFFKWPWYCTYVQFAFQNTVDSLT